MNPKLPRHPPRRPEVTDQDRRDLLNLSLGYTLGMLWRIQALTRRNAPQAQVDDAIDEGVEQVREWIERLGLSSPLVSSIPKRKPK